jgi:chromosome segregation ATPase
MNSHITHLLTSFLHHIWYQLPYHISQLNEYKTKLAAKETENAALMTKIEGLEQTIQGLKGELDTKLVSGVVASESIVNVLKKQLSEKEAEITKLNRLLEEGGQGSVELLAQKNKLADEKAKLETTLKDKSGQLELIQGQLDEYDLSELLFEKYLKYPGRWRSNRSRRFL